MVIEHVFVTTLPSGEALKGAATFLGQRGFVGDEQSGFTTGLDEWTALEMRRGKKRAGRAKNVAALPQKARLEYDRGRVTVALAIETNAAWGGSGILTRGSGESRNPKKLHLHAQVLKAIALGLENLLAHNGSGVLDYGLLDAAEEACDLAARKKAIRNRVILASLIVIAVGAIFLVMLAVVHS